MIMDDGDALTVKFFRLMRATLAEEKAGEDTLGRTVELARAWGTGAAADAELSEALRRLHGEGPDNPADTHGPGAVGATDPGAQARGRAIARFAANARRLREGEISPAEFDQIMEEGGEG